MPARPRRGSRVLRHDSGRRVGEVGEQREVDVGIHVPERLHLEVLEHDSTASTLVRRVGTMTMVRASSGTPLASSSRGRRRGGASRRRSHWTSAMASWLAGMSASRTTRGTRVRCRRRRSVATAAGPQPVRSAIKPR